MTKRETLKWTLQIIASVITAILTALGTTSCMGMQQKGHPIRMPFLVMVTYNDLKDLLYYKCDTSISSKRKEMVSSNSSNALERLVRGMKIDINQSE